MIQIDPETIKALGTTEAFIVVLILLIITIPSAIWAMNRFTSGLAKERQATETSQTKMNAALMELFQSLNAALQAQTKAIQDTQVNLPGNVSKEITGAVMPGIRIIASEMSDLAVSSKGTDSRVQAVIEQNAEIKQEIIKQFEGLPDVIRAELASVITRLDELNIIATAGKNAGDKMISDLSTVRSELVTAIAKLASVAPPVAPVNPVIAIDPAPALVEKTA